MPLPTTDVESVEILFSNGLRTVNEPMHQAHNKGRLTFRKIDYTISLQNKTIAIFKTKK